MSTSPATPDADALLGPLAPGPSFVVDGAQHWAAGHIGIYPGVWMIAWLLRRALQTPARGGQRPACWSLPSVTVRRSPRPGERLWLHAAPTRRQGIVRLCATTAPSDDARRARVVEALWQPEAAPLETASALPASLPPLGAAAPWLRRDPLVGALFALPRSSGGETCWAGRLVDPGPLHWSLSGLSIAPSLWMVEGMGQLVFAGLGALGLLPVDRADLVAGRIRDGWLSNRVVHGPVMGRVELRRHGLDFGVAQVRADDARGPLCRAELLYAPLDEGVTDG